MPFHYFLPDMFSRKHKKGGKAPFKMPNKRRQKRLRSEIVALFLQSTSWKHTKSYSTYKYTTMILSTLSTNVQQKTRGHSAPIHRCGDDVRSIHGDVLCDDNTSQYKSSSCFCSYWEVEGGKASIYFSSICRLATSARI